MAVVKTGKAYKMLRRHIGIIAQGYFGYPLAILILVDIAFQN